MENFYSEEDCVLTRSATLYESRLMDSEVRKGAQ